MRKTNDFPPGCLTWIMASATTSEFVKTTDRADVPPFSLIESKGLTARLTEELARASSDLIHDPRGFILGFFNAETKDLKRRRRIYLGLACALAAHIALIALIVAAGWNHVVNRPATHEVVDWVSPPIASATIPDASKVEQPGGENGGGGGGGQNALRPATKGATPQMLPQPQIVSPTAPSLPKPLLPLPSTIVGPESPPVAPDMQLGVMDGKIDAPPSPGTGTGGGLGDGKGPGVGSGTGPGAGAGSGGGPGGNNRAAGSPEGTGPAPPPFDFRKTQKPAGFVNFSWLYRSRPIVTPEAQENKVKGEVLLQATFRSDGRITDIEVLRPIEYMTESAVESLKRSKFRPATINGVPVTVINVYIRIRIDVEKP